MKKIVISAITLAVGLFSIGIVQLATANSTVEQTWQPLSSLVTTEKLTEIITENTAPSADREAIAAAAIAYEQNGLLLVDFNVPVLCGRGGCSLAGYRSSTGERVLNVYVERMNRDEPIVEVVDRDGFELPCLLVPPDPTNVSIFEETDKDTLCYQNESWSIQ